MYIIVYTFREFLSGYKLILMLNRINYRDKEFFYKFTSLHIDRAGGMWGWGIF